MDSRLIKRLVAPLPSSELCALVVLAGGNSHAYLITEQIAADSLSDIELHKSTVRKALIRLVSDGLIEASGREAGQNTGKQRQLYALTEAGWQRLRSEQRRLHQLTRVLDGRLAAHEHGLI